MTLKDEIELAVRATFTSTWTKRAGTVVPESENVGLGNEAVMLNGTVLYADLDGSTNMVDRYEKFFAAEIYKTYLYATAKVIRSEGGMIAA